VDQPVAAVAADSYDSPVNGVLAAQQQHGVALGAFGSTFKAPHLMLATTSTPHQGGPKPMEISPVQVPTGSSCIGQEATAAAGAISSATSLLVAFGAAADSSSSGQVSMLRVCSMRRVHRTAMSINTRLWKQAVWRCLRKLQQKHSLVMRST
jgi:hypothetical protein